MLLQLCQRLAALASLAVLAVGAYLFWVWWDLHHGPAQAPFRGEEDWRLWTALALLALSGLGRWPVLWLLARSGDDAERLKRTGGDPLLQTTTGAQLHLESSGPPDAPAIFLVHGWGLDASVWWEARQRLSRRFRVVAFDLAGLGKSKGPAKDACSLEGFADDLACVVERLSPRRAVLVGHSIGGMVLQTLCRRRPDLLGSQVVGLVLENTTYTDPSRTTILGPGIATVEPALKALMRLDIPLSPLLRLINWQSYLSGWTHVAMRFGFGARPTRAQLEQVALCVTRNSPAVQAHGNLAMMAWDGADSLVELRAAALVFTGGRDIVTVPRAGEVIARKAPQATLLREPVAGHMGPLELADRYNGAIERFADTVFTSGAAWADRPPANGAAGPPVRQPGGRADGDVAAERDGLGPR